MLDLAIRGGSIINGTGAPAYRADVGIKDGRIVSIGTDVPAAHESIPATDLIVAPGFINVHTHYDAQVMWDPGVTPSSLHGVTTIIGGNCGFTIAPVDASSRDYVMQMLACVEGMPVKALEASLSWDWESFGEWLGKLDGRLALNAGFSVGHSTIRRLVMGEEWKRAATDEEIAEMERHLDESLDAGALGFSSSWGEAHADHLGNPVPSRFAEPEEMIRLTSRLRGRPGTMLEFIPGFDTTFSDRAVGVMIDMAVTAGRPLNWNALVVGMGADQESNRTRLAISDEAAERGAKIIALALPIPMRIRINLLTAIVYNSVPAWSKVLALPFEERLAALSSDAVRVTLAEAVKAKEQWIFFNFGPMTVESVANEAQKDLVGRTVGDIAAARGRTPLDTFLDIAVSDNLCTCFAPPLTGDDDASWRLRLDLWKDARVVIGASDAGAHSDMIATFGYFTDFVGPTVRDRKLLSLEEAVRMVTSLPAKLYGIKDRGRLAPGTHADVVVFDADSIATGDVTLRDDMPGGERRLYAGALGVEHVVVNGVEVVTRGKLTGKTPGTVLRSGHDTV